MKLIITLKNLSDDSLRYVKQLGVDYVKLDVNLIPGFRQKRRLTIEDLLSVIRYVADFDLHLDFFGIAKGMMLAPLLAGDREAARNLEQVEEIIELLGEVEGSMLELDSGIHSYDVMFPQPCARLGYFEKPGRGGAPTKTFDLEVAKKYYNYRTKLGTIGEQTVWPKMIELYRRMVSIAEAHEVKICWEGDDPPIVDYRNLYRPLVSLKNINQLLDAVPSEFHGIIYCIGARAAAGEDVIAGIRHFSSLGKLFHVHSRNIRGKAPYWEEGFIDEGQLDMKEIYRTLRDVGYNGYIAPDSFAHYPRVLNENYPGLISMAYAVGYSKALIEMIYSE